MIERLKKRRDFLATAKGSKSARSAFVLESRARGDANPPRVGFTVSKRTAKKAVERNRIRRRLKEAVRLAGDTHIPGGCDYVLVGRRAALSQRFAAIQADLAGALAKAPGSDPRRGRTAARSSNR